MDDQRATEITVTLPNGTVRFPRFRLERGGKLTQEQVDAEAAAFAEADRLMGFRTPGPRQPGDDDHGAAVPQERRTREQIEQDVDFEARAVKAMAKREERWR